MKKNELLAFALLCTVSAAAGLGAWYWLQLQRAADAQAQRPDLEFRDLDGRAQKLSQWDGKLVLLNFWATWCAPCLKEIPHLVEMQREYGPRGLQVVGLAIDQRELVTRFAERLRINYPIMLGEAELFGVMDQLGDELGALPFSVLIAPDGRIVERRWGALTREEMVEMISQRLPS